MECCRSPHELMVQNKLDGIANPYRETHSRVFKILDAIEGVKPAIDIERALYFTKSMEKTEGEALVLRWAKAMKHIAENMTVYIDDDSLICGRAGYKGRYGILYPELDGDFLGMAVEELPQRDNSPFSISEEDVKIVVEEIAPYWQGKTYHEALNAAFPPD